MITALRAWFAQPFTSDMDAWRWAMFVGFILIVAFAWTRVMQHIQEI